MRYSKLTFTIALFVASFMTSNAQFYKNFSLDIGINHSKNFNTDQLFPDLDEEQSTSRIRENSSSTRNISMSLGYRIHKNHYLKIRHSKNSLGSHITGNFFYNPGWCGLGGQFYNLKNSFNEIKNTTLGAMYEFRFPVVEGNLSFGIGFEKQWNNYEETILFFDGIGGENYAIHSSAAYQLPLYSVLDLYTKVFVTRSFEGSEYGFHSRLNGKYIPLQLGLEVGFSVNFERL